MTRPSILSALILLAFLSTPTLAATADAPPGAVGAGDPELLPSPEGKRTVAELFAINTLVWSYDRHVRAGGGAGFRIGFNTWWENLENGFEWDDNNFGTNQFAHPFHGNLYFSVARSNGYSFWTSSGFAFMGSFMWEYFGETHHPSINDWFATSIGGTALGESLWRLSGLVLDNTATGGERTRREIGAFVINPMRGVNRLLDGKTRRVGANPANRLPHELKSTLAIGVRTMANDRFGQADTTRAYVDYQFTWGDPFAGDLEQPFDSFDFGVQLTPGDASVIGNAWARGLLWGREAHSSDRVDHIVAIYQHYDFLENTAYEFAGQSLGAAFLSRETTPAGFAVRADIHLNAILMGATKSDYLNESGREYDYGPGIGFKFRASFLRNGWEYLQVGQDVQVVHAVNGNRADHALTMTRVRLRVPLRPWLGVGAEYELYYAERRYDLFADVIQRTPEARAFLTWQLR